MFKLRIPANKLLFKYRTLDSFERIIDVLLNDRMFAAPFLDLNDPMEGRYVFPSRVTAGKTVIKRAAVGSEDYRILSLSATWQNTLMWSHYAGQHTGVSIGVRLENIRDLRRVDYVDDLTKIDNKPSRHEMNLRLLSRKHSFWDYEEEYRVILKNRQFVAIRPIEIILGVNMPKDMKELILELVDRIRPEVEVYQMQKSDLDVVT